MDTLLQLRITFNLRVAKESADQSGAVVFVLCRQVERKRAESMHGAAAGLL